MIRIHPDGGITTIARSGNSTQKWRKLQNGEDIGEAPLPTKPNTDNKGKFVRMGSKMGLEKILNQSFNKFTYEGDEVWGGVKNIDEFSDMRFTASMDLNTKEFTFYPSVRFDKNGPLEILYFKDGVTEVPLEFIQNRTGGHRAATSTLVKKLDAKGFETQPKMTVQNKRYGKWNGEEYLLDEPLTAEKSAMAGFAIIKEGNTLKINYKSNQLNKTWDGVLDPRQKLGKDPATWIRNEGNIVPSWKFQGRNYRKEIKKAVKEMFPQYTIKDL